MEHERVLVLDFGAQYSQLIARRIRELGVLAEIVPYDLGYEQILSLRPKAIILSGGPSSVYASGAPHPDPRLYEGAVPIFGICYGMQLMAQGLGGVVNSAEAHEYGKTMVTLKEAPIFTGLPRSIQSWMSHADRVEEVPTGFTVLAESANAPVAAMGDGKTRFAVQFHPEVVHTQGGTEMLRHFLFEIAHCRGDWQMNSFIDEAVTKIQAVVGDGHALVALSGGVDSAVAAALVYRAIGERLTAVFVDHGFLRAGEAELVVDTFGNHFGVPLRYVDAKVRFLERLVGISDPEVKRKRIGEEFIRVFEKESHAMGSVQFLVQGTLYPDVIESGHGKAAVIKSHHNVGGLPEDMQFELVEPLRDLFKDEVRKVGLELGLPDRMVYRQPFPGPGLAIRIIGDVTLDRLSILRRADKIVVDVIEQSGFAKGLWQYFCVLPNIRSVGVMGDGRTYAYPLVVRATTSEDGMTADFARLPYEVLEEITQKVISAIPEINRVVYDVTSKPPGTIEWE